MPGLQEANKGVSDSRAYVWATHGEGHPSPPFSVVTNGAARSSLRAECPLLGFIPSPQLRAGAQQTAVEKLVAEMGEQRKPLGGGCVVMSKAGVQKPGKLGQHVRRRLGREEDAACQGWGFPGSHVSRSSLWPQASARREGPGQARGCMQGIREEGER